MHATEQPGEDPLEIRLTLPALEPYARVARLAITGIATRSGFTYDEVEDLRIAVGEVFGMLVVPPDPDATLRFACELDDDALRVAVVRHPPHPLAEVGELSTLILAAVVDESTIDGPAGRIEVAKRREPRS